MNYLEFKINLLFEKYKNYPITPKLMHEIKDKYNLNNDLTTDLRARLINYQIEYWGEQISTARENPPFDTKRVYQAHIQRQINKRKRLGLNR